MPASDDFVRVCHVGYASPPYWKDAILVERINYPNGQQGWMVEIKDHPGEWFVPDEHIIVLYDRMTPRWIVCMLRAHNSEKPCSCLRCSVIRAITPMASRIYTAFWNWRYARKVRKALEDARAV